MIIGIGGISRSGKTTVSSFLKKQLGASCILIHMDNYIMDSANWDVLIKKPLFYLSKIHKKFDLAHPETILDFDSLYMDIIKAKEAYGSVIIDGSYICYDHRIKSLLDKYIHLEISKEEFIQRRLNDYKKENRWYANHLWKRFIKFGLNFYELDHLVISDDKNGNKAAILQFIGNIYLGTKKEKVNNILG